jgi:transcription antitermination protein NusB
VRAPTSVMAAPSRKTARRDALFVLYQLEVRDTEPAILLAEVKEREGYTADEYTVALVDGVREWQPGLDATLAAHATSWPLERMAPLERSLLRLALYEMEHGLVPAEVAVNEAVRLARRYSTDEAGVLVNGVLGAVLRDREEG